MKDSRQVSWRSVIVTAIEIGNRVEKIWWIEEGKKRGEREKRKEGSYE